MSSKLTNAARQSFARPFKQYAGLEFTPSTPLFDKCGYVQNVMRSVKTRSIPVGIAGMGRDGVQSKDTAAFQEPNLPQKGSHTSGEQTPMDLIRL